LEFRNIEGDLVRPAEFKSIPTAFIRLKPAYDSDLEAREGVMKVSVFYSDHEMDIWMQCAVIPEDGETIANGIWEYLYLPKDWKLCFENGELRPEDHLVERNQRLQVRLLSDLEAALHTRFRYFRVQGENRSVPIGENPLKYLQLPE
jgi:hypothetical protein